MLGGSCFRLLYPDRLSSVNPSFSDSIDEGISSRVRLLLENNFWKTSLVKVLNGNLISESISSSTSDGQSMMVSGSNCNSEQFLIFSDLSSLHWPISWLNSAKSSQSSRYIVYIFLHIAISSGTLLSSLIFLSFIYFSYGQDVRVSSDSTVVPLNYSMLS